MKAPCGCYLNDAGEGHWSACMYDPADIIRPEWAPPACPECGQQVEVHREGWLYDHAVDGTLTGNLCSGSGATVSESRIEQEIETSTDTPVKFNTKLEVID